MEPCVLQDSSIDFNAKGGLGEAEVFQDLRDKGEGEYTRTGEYYSKKPLGQDVVVQPPFMCFPHVSVENQCTEKYMNEVPLIAFAHAIDECFGLSDDVAEGREDGTRELLMMYDRSWAGVLADIDIDIYLEEADKSAEWHHSISDRLCRHLHLWNLDKCEMKANVAGKGFVNCGNEGSRYLDNQVTERRIHEIPDGPLKKDAVTGRLAGKLSITRLAYDELKAFVVEHASSRTFLGE